jgi:hypothetical protein
VYFLTESGFLSVSTNSGENWPTLRDVNFGRVILIDGKRPNRVFGGGFVGGVKRGGVYSSENNGQTFSFVGPLDKTIGSLALDGRSRILFAVVYGEGIYSLALSRGLPILLPRRVTKVAVIALANKIARTACVHRTGGEGVSRQNPPGSVVRTQGHGMADHRSALRWSTGDTRLAELGQAQRAAVGVTTVHAEARRNDPKGRTLQRKNRSSVL